MNLVTNLPPSIFNRYLQTSIHPLHMHAQAFAAASFSAFSALSIAL
jgi:hypothetical protein